MRRLIGALSGAIVITAMAASMAFASHAIPGDNVAPNANSHSYVEGNPRCGEDQIGGPGQITPVKCIPQAHSVNAAANSKLRRRVRLADA